MKVADIHLGIDAKNLVTTARTKDLLEQKKTIHMISMLRKEDCSGSMHDLAHIPTQNCLADGLTKTSAKTDNLITAMKTGCWMLTYIPIVEHSWNMKPAYLHDAGHLCTQRRRMSFFLNALKVSLAPTPQEGPQIPVLLRRPRHRTSACWGRTATKFVKRSESGPQDPRPAIT